MSSDYVPHQRGLAAVRSLILMIAGLALSGAARPPQPFAPPDPARRVSLTAAGWKVTDASCPSLGVDAGLRQRIVDIAAEEWARFGYQTEEIQKTGLSVVPRPERGRIVSPGLNAVRPGITRRGLRLGRMEDDRPVLAAIGGYWAATPANHAIDIQNRLRAVYAPTGWAVPWSAAFVSYVVCAAGVGDLQQFLRAEGHWSYVDQAIRATDGQAPRAIYHARDIATGLPHEGDLVCLDRTGGTLRSVADKRRQAGELPLHCDIVVRVDRSHGMAALVGGNVVQSVTMSLVNIRPARHGRPAKLETSADIAGGRTYFVILELTTGGRASLDRAPAMRKIARR